ncbi:MAG: site-specific integrase [Ruminococcaceae bacterium]|nr:site-specific integrase [Oscillospiraceae bacterium]
MPRKGENIYKRKDGRWEGRYIKEYDLENKAKYASVYAHSYLEAKSKLIKAKNNCIDLKPKIQGSTLRSYADKWLMNIEPQIKRSTFVKYTNTINNHISPFIGNMRIKDITTDVIKNYVFKKLNNGNITTEKGLSPKTVKDIISVIKLILNYAEEHGETAVCNFKQINIKSSIIPGLDITKTSQEQLTKYLLKEIDYTKLGILLCLYTGIRIGELCAIRYEDISVKERIIRITKTMQRLQTFADSNKKTEIVITEPKSFSSLREIPIPDFIMDIILTFDFKENAYILTGKSDKFVEPRTLEYRFKACLKACGVEDYKFHQLRHRFASQCVELGFDIKSLSEILGHASVNITLNRYVHSSMELKRANMNKLQYSIVY